MNIPDHPDIDWCVRTGYPQWNQPHIVHCERCGDEIEDDVYEDFNYSNLCADCLLRLHRKDR